MLDGRMEYAPKMIAVAVAVITAAVVPPGPTLAQDFLFDTSVYGDVNLPLPQSVGNLESLIINNPNFDLLGLVDPEDRLRLLSRPVGRLDVLFEEGTATCTAFVIAPEHILTNHHCVPGLPSSGRIVNTTLLMGYYDELDTSGVERFPVLPEPVETSPVAELDYSILKVVGDPSETWGMVTLSAEDPRPAASLLLIHHPAGRPKMVTRGGCLAASPTPVNDTTLFHRCDSMGGSSGSPVFLDATGEVIALHHAGVVSRAREEFNKAKRMSRIAAASPTVAGLIGDQIASLPPAEQPQPAPAATEPADAAAEIRLPIGVSLADWVLSG